MIKNIKGDLLNSPATHIMHCANCFCTMGSGIARQIKEDYPEAYEADCVTKTGDKNKLGCFSSATTHDGKMIFNLYGQYRYGTESRKLNYEAIYNAMMLVSEVCDTLHDCGKKVVVGLPYKMGCALAGGDWHIVNAMVESIFGNKPYDVFIVEFGKYAPNPQKQPELNDFL